ncbi:molybdate ABC transporter permease (plasmid) [Antarctobacter heliothermus]|uniref:Molybdate ABC transporter permease n=1 Tax=Antarctobacter heliothermus TaxID=74033 RepID=A0A222EBZ9_9RHOB|nr:ABC transporter permease [Antarctobacter heliothermus]ASP23705.1 molybdate ABC transporter permease [Antarctobacter heliothermus]
MSEAPSIALNRSAPPARDAAAIASRKGRRRDRMRRLGQMAPVLLLYLVGIVLPYVALARMSFNLYDPMFIFREMWSLQNYADIFAEPYYLTVILRTIALGVSVTFFTVLLGYPLAWKIARSGPMMRSILLSIALSPLLINLVVRTYAWLVMLGEQGVLNQGFSLLGLGPYSLIGGWFAVVVGMVHMTLPFMVLSLTSVMQSLPGHLLEASENLGATSLRTFTHVIWPLTLPGVGAGAILVFSFTISAFVTPALLGGGTVATVSTLIYEQFTYALNWPFGAAMVFVLLAMNMIMLALHALLFRTGDS